MRDLNAYSALSFTKYAGSYSGSGSTIVRIFNVDDVTWSAFSNPPTLDWNVRYGDEGYINDSYYGVTGLVSGQYINFSTYNFGNSSSFGYQIYRGGLISKEKILGAASRYQTWGTNNLIYNSVGVTSPQNNWVPEGNWAYQY